MTVRGADGNELTDAEMIEVLAGEVIELRLRCSQSVEAYKRKMADALDMRKYMDARRWEGRKDVYEGVTAYLDKMIEEYELRRINAR